MGSKISTFLDEWRDEPFSWQTHHCLIFIARAVHHQTDWWFYDVEALECDNQRNALAKLMQFMKEMQFDDIPALLDHYFVRSPGIPPDGSIVLRSGVTDEGCGIACGIVSGDRGVFVDHNGLEFVKLDPSTDLYWKMPDAIP